MHDMKEIQKTRAEYVDKYFSEEYGTIGLSDFAKYMYSLQFESEPNYDKIKFFFVKNLLDSQ